MNNTNPEIEEQLSKLTDICCKALDSQTPDITAETEAVLRALVMSGFARMEGAPLQVQIENRVNSRCESSAMNRGGALTSITGQLQSKFDNLVRWESQQPDSQTQSKAANISSATKS
ncbi:hypothetical protein [Planctomycetes bacterium K23_9]|uniref:Uncharacterized protein n=1 Tax=Stieleria marina TaxID=1930275 RepID=A0A517NQ81_9BACT|nr:hypothetical protein K239x_12220 [Planctomycetes bacterium K23_9]